MKWLSLSLFILLLASCSRFSVPHYRKLKLVPAEENAFSAKSTVISVSDLALRGEMISDSEDCAESAPDTSQAVSVCGDTEFRVAVSNAGNEKVTMDRSHAFTPVKSYQEQPIPIRRDWSVFIAIVLLFAGIILLLWSIAIFFTLPAVFWIRLLIGIGMMPLAIRMILFGTRILFNRWRNPVNYKESDR